MMRMMMMMMMMMTTTTMMMGNKGADAKPRGQYGRRDSF